MTNATRKVFANPDGTETAKLTTRPVRYQTSDGRWHEFDGTLVRAGKEIAPTSAPSGAAVAADAASEQLVSVPTAAGPIALAQDDAASAPGVIKDDAVTYANAVDGTSDLEVALTPTGFETTLQVDQVEPGSESFTQTLSLPDGVTARNGGPGVELVSQSGAVIGSYGSGMAFDSAARPGQVPVTTRLLDQSPGSASVVVSVPAAWIIAPERVLPVLIDPTFSTTTGSTGSLDTFVQLGSTVEQSNAVTMLVGPQASNTAVRRRAFLKFDLSSIQGLNRSVQAATLDLHSYGSPSCTAKGMDVRNLTSSFAGAVTWNSQPSWGSTTVTSTFAKGFSSACPGGNQSIDVQPIVADWMFNSTNYGFGLKATNEADALADKTVTSAESWVPPVLTVTYNRPPSQGATQAAPADGAVVNTTQPTLDINAGVDPDADPLSYWWAVSSKPDGTGQVLASGWLPAARTGGLSWTVPAGSLVDGETYYWTVYTADNLSWPAAPPTTRSFTVDTRLGDGNWPVDEVGPASVNLTTGNLMTTHDGRSFNTATGPLGASFSYNSMATTKLGLTGSYWALFGNPASHRPATGQEPALVRRDPTVVFDWGTGSPGYQIPNDLFYSKWTGTFIAPTTGNYKFGGTCSDGMTISVNNSMAFDRWTGCSASDPDPWSGLIALTAGQAIPISIEHWENTATASINVKVRGPGLPTGIGTDLRAEWLAPSQPSRLPNGWEASLSLSGGSGYRYADIANGSFNAVDESGALHHYAWDAAKAAWQPPEGANGTLTTRSDGGYTLVGDDGLTHSFSPSGVLQSSWTSLEKAGGAMPVYTWDGLGRLASIKDPASGRKLALAYAGSSTCSSATGFSPAPSGMLCALDYGEFSGGTTQLRYNANGQLARFEDPGAAITDYSYDTAGRLNKIRDALAADAIAAGVRTDTDATRTVIGYGTDGRVGSVQQPEPLAGEARPQHSYTYTNSTTTDIAAAGLTSTTGRFRRVVFDSAGRVTADTDLAGRTISQTFNADGDPLTRLDSSTGLKGTVIYDAVGNVTDEWGPAPSSWWPSASAPGAPTSNVSATPHVTSAYDQGFGTLRGVWWNNTGFAGTPVAATNGVGDATGRIVSNWGPSGPAGQASGFAGVVSGWIDIPNTNTWSFKLDYAGQARVLINDKLVADGWAGGSSVQGTYQGAAGRTSISIIYANTNGTASLNLSWHDTGGAFTPVPGTNLSPGYGLATSRTDADGRVTAFGYSDATSGLTPADGIRVSTTVDPAGSALVTSDGFESAGHRRNTSHRLPTGAPSESTTTYWADTATYTVPCPGGATGVPQGGQLRYVTAADPDGSGSQLAVQTELVYDTAGRVAATRIVGDGANWTCTTFDSRGRPTQTIYPDLSDRPGRTLAVNYSASGNPLKTSVSDTPAGGIASVVSSEVDLLGQARVYTDTWNNQTTTTYDQVGRPTTSSSPVGVVTVTPYDSGGNPGPTKLDGTALATPHWDGAGRLSYVDYANGSKSAAATFDSLGRQTLLEWQTSGGTAITKDQLTYSLDGLALDQSVDGSDARAANLNFTYDGAGRLTEAWTTAISSAGAVSSLHTAYGYGAASPSCASGTRSTAGANTNRTSQVVGDGGTAVTTSYCYDDADRLVSTSQAGVGTPSYDSHGNAASIWGETRSYDSSNRHIGTTKGTQVLTYGRDGTNRMVSRKVVTDGVTGDNTRYGYTGDGDGPSVVQTTTGVTLDKVLPLPGGATVTLRGSAQIWAYPNLHGDITAIADGNGAKQGQTITSDPYGNTVTTPDTLTGTHDPGWLGAYQRGTEHAATLALTVEMGDRQYDPVLGRFLSTDPERGGSANAYSYVEGDPIMAHDIDGHRTVNFRCDGIIHWWCAWWISSTRTREISKRLEGWRGVVTGALWAGAICWTLSGPGAYACGIVIALGFYYVQSHFAQAARRYHCAVIKVNWVLIYMYDESVYTNDCYRN